MRMRSFNVLYVRESQVWVQLQCHVATYQVHVSVIARSDNGNGLRTRDALVHTELSSSAQEKLKEN